MFSPLDDYHFFTHGCVVNLGDLCDHIKGTKLWHLHWPAFPKAQKILSSGDYFTKPKSSLEGGSEKRFRQHFLGKQQYFHGWSLLTQKDCGFSELFRDVSCFCAFCRTQKNNNKDISLLQILRKKNSFFSFLFVTHLMPESSRKREGMKIFKRTGCLTTRVIFHPTHADMHVQERRHCLSHWIIIWMIS